MIEAQMMYGIRYEDKVQKSFTICHKLSWLELCLDLDIRKEGFPSVAT